MRRHGERGSALLIVFVFAAFVAIMLYKELPIYAFEAQRQKEQLLMNRGDEYKRAVKLFYLKFHSYPANIDQLENTNRMRFLRHRFKDPLTGKDDWRLLHMGPAGMLVDSKVNPLKPAGQNGAFGSGSDDAASASNIPQGPVSLGAPVAFRTPGMPVVDHPYPNQNTEPQQVGGVGTQPAFPLRPPAISAAGGPPAPQDPNNPDQSGAAQNPPNSADAFQNSPGLSPNGQTAGVEGVPQQDQNNGGFQPSPPSQQRGRGQQGLFPPMQRGMGNAVGGATPQNAGSGFGGDANTGVDAVNNQLRTTNTPQTQQQSGAFNSGQGTIQGGAFAGVASKAEGHTIKVMDDQTDYSKWEFYYDPRKDVTPIMGGGNGLGLGGVQNMGANNGNFWTPPQSGGAPQNPSPSPGTTQASTETPPPAGQNSLPPPQ